GGEHVIGELSDRPNPGPLAHVLTPGPIREQFVEGRDRLVDRGRILDDEAGLVVLDGVGSTPAGASDLGDSGGGGLEELDPEALLFEAEPARPAGHREEIRGTVEQRQILMVDAAQQPNRSAGSIDQSLQSTVVSTRTPDEHAQTGMMALELGRCPDEDVEAFARYETADRHDEISVSVDIEELAARLAFGQIEGSEPFRVDPGRDHLDR